MVLIERLTGLPTGLASPTLRSIPASARGKGASQHDAGKQTWAKSLR